MAPYLVTLVLVKERLLAIDSVIAKPEKLLLLMMKMYWHLMS